MFSITCGCGMACAGAFVARRSFQVCSALPVDTFGCEASLLLHANQGEPTARPANTARGLEEEGSFSAARLSSGDASSDRSQRRAIVETHAGSIRLDTKLCPQAIQVHADRLVFHSCV